MDPLRLLREYVSGGRLEEVTTVGDRVHFGTRFALPRSARTAYKSQAKDGAFYDLGALLFYARNLGPTFKYADYFKKAREAGVGQVTFIDRKVSPWAGACRCGGPCGFDCIFLARWGSEAAGLDASGSTRGTAPW